MGGVRERFFSKLLFGGKKVKAVVNKIHYTLKVRREGSTKLVVG